MTDAMPEGPARSDEMLAARAAAIREKAISEAPRHGRLLRSGRDGSILSAIMRSFYIFGTAPGHGVLTTIGRKSGNPRHKCIRAIRRGDKAYVVMLRPPALAVERPAAIASWVWNIRADPHVRLRLGRRTFTGVAREITDPAELEQAREAICETVHLIDYGECNLHLRGFPTRAKIQNLHRYWFDTGVPLVIEFADQKHSGES
jgi:deazaflavin-dependent oxidoreductase (nitroreductase family)